MRTPNESPTIAHARIRRMSQPMPLDTHAYIKGADAIGVVIGNACCVISLTYDGKDFYDHFEEQINAGQIDHIHCGEEVEHFELLSKLAASRGISFRATDRPKGAPGKRLQKMWRLGFMVSSQEEADALWLFRTGDPARTGLMGSLGAHHDN